MIDSLIQVCVVRVDVIAEGVLSLELRTPDDSRLPLIEPGAHIDLHLPNGLVRQYSLYGSQHSGECYKIAVLLEEQGRGGSWAIHNLLSPGITLQISLPCNHFPVVDAQHSFLFSGGVGITPIICKTQSKS